MHKIQFVCHGNICRSPMAEFVMKKLVADKGLSDKFYITSAATSTEEIGNGIDYRARRQLIKMGIPFSDSKTAVQVSRLDYDKYDYFIVMDDWNARNINRIFLSDKEGKVHKLMSFTGSNADVDDPWYSGDFDKAYKDILAGCTALLQKLT